MRSPGPRTPFTNPNEVGTTNSSANTEPAALLAIGPSGRGFHVDPSIRPKARPVARGRQLNRGGCEQDCPGGRGGPRARGPVWQIPLVCLRLPGETRGRGAQNNSFCHDGSATGRRRGKFRWFANSVLGKCPSPVHKTTVFVTVPHARPGQPHETAPAERAGDGGRLCGPARRDGQCRHDA